jgi:hypothetical protein
MTATIRNLTQVFSPTHQSRYQNLLVSGCSYTWNNSNQHICTWPYYLRDLANFEEVFDCSQGGAGNNHIFNSVVNELSTNQNLTPNNTCVIIMWSGLERVDFICRSDVVKNSRPTGLTGYYQFDEADTFASLSVWPSSKDSLQELLKTYRVTVDLSAQILESAIKIIALKEFLQSLGYTFCFVDWRDQQYQINNFDNTIVDKASSTISKIETLNSFTTRKGTRVADGHPTPDSHLSWTQEILLPHLIETNTI